MLLDLTNIGQTWCFSKSYYPKLQYKVQGYYSFESIFYEINVWFDRLSKADCIPPRWWASSNSLKVWLEEKQSRETFTFSNCFHAGTLSFSCLYTLNCVWNYTSAILVLRLSDSDWNYTTGSPGCLPFQLQTLRLFSLHTMWANSL